jgi:hypothetical protein
VSYVIYHTTSKHRFETRNGSVWPLERTAKAVKTKNKLGDEWKVASYGDWQADDHEIEVKSVMGGTVKIKASNKGSRASDPSMEGYWTL